MGNTLDVSHTSKDMQAIIASQGPQQVSNKVSAGKALPKGHTTQAQLKSIDMNTKIAATRSQARDLADATGKA
jgi:hypothetical protein